MKMFKKLMAVVLAGVMAVSMLTGCAISDKFVSDAAKDAVSAMANGATVSVSTKTANKDDVKAVRKYVVEQLKDLDKTAPTQAMVTAAGTAAGSSDALYVLAKYENSSKKVQESVDASVKVALAAACTKDTKLSITISDKFSSYKEDGKNTKVDYVIIAVRAK